MFDRGGNNQVYPINDFVFWGRIRRTYIPQLCRWKSRQIWVKSEKK
ncbi:hypothetical protein VL20_2978 [Microcystis panniformis FACHB-1757]|uniref:Uncharacterized protein n=1 Tax=Microcystis panniformis FACHB-1757 TaxID=1638788 RepID=A0A0K1S1J3_9CHRO|nr:hypothetical protein VL20_2978 [Microcystis panniformis FACHB-1757]